MRFSERLKEASVLLQRFSEKPSLDQEIEKAIDMILDCVKAEKPLLVCGNGGSASDAEHITGELVGRFLKERRAINAISLVSNAAALTAWSNDYEYETVFSRQVEAHGKKGGLLFCISTSGNSKNILKAIESARDLGIPVIGMTGEGGGKMASLCDLLLDVPSKHTPRIQELHIHIYHHICEEVERRY
jgi:D-sedoheptulose 7-phosphate isomerase